MKKLPAHVEKVETIMEVKVDGNNQPYYIVYASPTVEIGQYVIACVDLVRQLALATHIPEEEIWALFDAERNYPTADNKVYQEH